MSAMGVRSPSTLPSVQHDPLQPLVDRQVVYEGPPRNRMRARRYGCTCIRLRGEPLCTSAQPEKQGALRNLILVGVEVIELLLHRWITSRQFLDRKVLGLIIRQA